MARFDFRGGRSAAALLLPCLMLGGTALQGGPRGKDAEEAAKLHERYKSAKTDKERVDLLFDAVKKLGTVEALRLVVSAIDQPVNAYLGDRAISALSSCKEAPALLEAAKEGLLHKEARVRRGVLEALVKARVDVPADLVLPLLGDTDEEVKLLVLEFLIHRRPDKLAPDVAKLASAADKDERMRATALIAAGGSDPAGAAKLIEAGAADPSPRVRIGALLARDAARTGAAEAAVIALGDADRRVRLAAMSIVEKARPKDAIPKMIEIVAREQGRVRERAADVLRAVTQRNFGTDAAAWTRWWEQSGKDFTPPPANDKDRKGKPVDASAPEGGTRATPPPKYHEFVVTSDRVAFLVDVSGSMRDEYTPKDETSTSKATKVERAAAALRDCLRALPKGTRVTVMVFNTAPVKFRHNGKDVGIELDAAVAEDAYKFVVGIGAKRATNINDALELVIDEPDVDTVYLITDGEPSAGKRNLGSRIADWAERTVRLSRTEVNTIGLGTDDKGRKFLERLAESTGGKFVER